MGFSIVQVQGSSQSPAQVRDALQTLTGLNRLDASAVKSLPISGGLSPWQLKTANYTAVTGDRIRAQLSGSDLTITCPLNPIVGDEFELQRIDTTANSLIINSNGNPFKGQISKDGLFNNGNIGLIERISYVDNTIGWLPQHDRLTYQTYTPPTGGIALTYASDGDTNGLFYYLGTSSLTTAFTNPVVSSAVLVQPSSIGVGDPITLTDRNLSDFYTNNAANSWIAWDIQSKQISVTKYTLRNRNDSGGYFMRSWILEGSNSTMTSFDLSNIDSATWTTIDTRTNDATFVVPNTFYTLTVNGSQANYRYLRYRSTGVDSTANNFLCMGEFEFYGSVT